MNKLHILLIGLITAIVVQIALYPINKAFQKEKRHQLLSKEETEHFSQNIGHLLSDTLKEYSPHYDFQIVLDTLKNVENKKIPIKSPEECQVGLLSTMGKILTLEVDQNLKSAENFLRDLSKKSNIVEVIKAKLYYEVIDEGKDPVITKESAPLLHFTETNLNNKVIRDTRGENKPIRIKLSETILGFSHGVSGMQIGERRKIYAHPDLTYERHSHKQLAIFDVEILSE
jgi:FKBP-type peptidyl-prolyl cis-trans isomerase